MDGAVVSWACKKQTGVSLSTMKAELIAASQAGCELLGLKGLFGELDMKVVEPMPMWMDNQAAIKQLGSEKSTSSAKHIDIRFISSATTLKSRRSRQVMLSLEKLLQTYGRRHCQRRGLWTYAICLS